MRITLKNRNGTLIAEKQLFHGQNAKDALLQLIDSYGFNSGDSYHYESEAKERRSASNTEIFSG